MAAFAPSARVITRSDCLFDVRPARADDEAALAEFSRHVTLGGGLRNLGSG